MTRSKRRGFSNPDNLITVVWLGIGVAIFLPLLRSASELSRARGLGFFGAFWIVMKDHWIATTLGTLVLFWPVVFLVLLIAETFRSALVNSIHRSDGEE